MKILIAEDDPVSRRLLRKALDHPDDQILIAEDGLQAWSALEKGMEEGEPPHLVVLDWIMPGLSGPELCRKVRETPALGLTYLILVTSMDRKEDLVAGLAAGAHDYVVKPFDPAELRARVEVGRRVVGLQSSLDARVKELEEALADVRRLESIVPVCCYCKRIRDDDKYWQNVEDYLARHSKAGFSHGICPDCWDSVVRPQMEEMWGESVPYEESAG